MTQSSKPSNNGDIIGELKQAEERAAREVAQASAAKDARIRKAQEQAGAIREKAAAEAGELKGKLIAAERASIAAEESKLLAASGKEADAVRRRRVGDGVVSSCFATLMGELDA